MKKFDSGSSQVLTVVDELVVIIPPANCVCGWLYPPQTVFVGGYTVFMLSVRPFVRNILFP